jgi:DNA-directed RNA polymerase specialized sigma24 family protein
MDEVGPVYAAEDVLQSALTEALDCDVPAEPNETLGHWFQPFLDRSIRRHTDLTSDHQQLHPAIDDVEELPDPDGPWEESPRSCVLECMFALRETDAHLILWLDIQGHSQKEMVKVMGIPLCAVSVRHVRARARLRILLEDRCGACRAGKCGYRPDRTWHQEQDGPQVGSLSMGYLRIRQISTAMTNGMSLAGT